jgi:hypothetical protein
MIGDGSTLKVAVAEPPPAVGWLYIATLVIMSL